MDKNEVNRVYNEAVAEHHGNYVKQAAMMSLEGPPPVMAPGAALAGLDFCADWPEIAGFIKQALNILKFIPFLPSNFKALIPKAKGALAVFDKVGMPLICGTTPPSP